MAKRASWKETLVGTCILLVLCGIAVGVLYEHARLNPPAGFAPAANPTPAVEVSKPSEGPQPAEFLVETVEPLSPPEIFNAENLSDKIDGKAEKYLPAGFAGMACQRFRLRADASAWFEAFLYDMSGPKNAYAVFSTQRREKARDVDFAPNAYRSGNSVFFAHGRYYVELIAAGDAPPLGEAMLAYAKMFVAKVPAEAVEQSEPGMFPPDGLRKDSIALLAADAFGCDRLTNIYTAEYQRGGKTLTAFLSRKASPKEASELAEAYRKMLLMMGAKALPAPPGAPDARAVELFGSVEIIFTRGNLLAGVHEAPDAAAAADLAALLSRRLTEPSK
jgi:hypothetical protein